MEEVMLTTIDNPYNPFDHFDEWYAWDEMDARQNNRATCCSYLARMSPLSDELSENEYDRVMNDTIDDIIELNLSGKFIKINRKGEKKVK